ncbi:hypothetical protein NQ152_12715 [Microbacterium sp. zg.B48]|uniref:hypothetical protein n=1 Tax=Microbacterium sp. zg.B48 TaxID=2969408 RepID=UPI00214C97F4|nr:hypothetical protein [Microbacterium sp. zg.B48]MCR2764366.1 hypothetical protein [Microbacterium sp. zg.B48]
MFTRVQQARANDEAGRSFGTGLILVAVELAEQEGLRYVSTVDGVAYDDLRHDMDVELTWVPRQGLLSPAFRPIDLKEEATIG